MNPEKANKPNVKLMSEFYNYPWTVKYSQQYKRKVFAISILGMDFTFVYDLESCTLWNSVSHMKI